MLTQVSAVMHAHTTTHARTLHAHNLKTFNQWLPTVCLGLGTHCVNLQADRGNSSCVDAWCYLAASPNTRRCVCQDTFIQSILGLICRIDEVWLKMTLLWMDLSSQLQVFDSAFLFCWAPYKYRNVYPHVCTRHAILTPMHNCLRDQWKII